MSLLSSFLKGNEFRPEFIVPGTTTELNRLFFSFFSTWTLLLSRTDPNLARYTTRPLAVCCIVVQAETMYAFISSGPSLNFVFLLFSDLIPEVNYTVDPGTRSHTNSFNPSNKQPSSPSNPHPGGGSSSSSGNSNNPAVFVPSPASSNRSPTMYNMDQLTNNIAIPKHVLPNPSNLATSRSTVVVDDNGRQEDNFGGGGGGGGGGDDRDERYMNPNLNSPSNNGNNHLDHSSGDRGGESNPYSYDDEDSAGGVGGGGLGEDASSKGGFMGAEVQGKRGTWKGSDGLDGGDNSNRDGNGKNLVNYFICGNGLRVNISFKSDLFSPRMIIAGPKYIVCDALCGAWNHQCKLMGILFSITSVLCLIFSLVVLHSLHFSLRGKSFAFSAAFSSSLESPSVLMKMDTSNQWL